MASLATSAVVAAESSRSPLYALQDRLDEIASLLMEIDPRLYVARPAPGVSGSVGGHLRHALDHISALLAGEGSSELSYDRRERGTAVESDPGAALRQILRLRAALDRAVPRSLDEPILVRSMVSSSAETTTAWSTFGREVAFVMSHTIHHQAIIALLLDLQGVGVPHRFGVAPSSPTPR
jgi:uncharacterized damage-inducible protein DinB